MPHLKNFMGLTGGRVTPPEGLVGSTTYQYIGVAGMPHTYTQQAGP